MPEGIEVEYYRRAARVVVGRVIDDLRVVDDAYVRGSPAPMLADMVRGLVVTAVRRRGKLLMLDLGDPVAGEQPAVTLGLRFGMTGRLVVDGDAPIDRLLYSASEDQPMHRRAEVRFAGHGALVMMDPRRLGSIEAEPDEERVVDDHRGAAHRAHHPEPCQTGHRGGAERARVGSPVFRQRPDVHDERSR